MIKRLLLALCIISTLTLSAQQPHRRGGDRRPARTEWMRKMKQLKHEFMTRELGLSAEQQKAFFALYDAKEDERFQAERAVRHSDRALFDRVDDASDSELDAAIEAQYELDSKLAQIEKKYVLKFRKVLTRQQLFKLRHVEREFQKMLMERRNQSCPSSRK